MRKLLFILFLLSSGFCYAQEPVFNFETNKLYKISLLGVDNYEKADDIARTMEKNLLSIFSYVDHIEGNGYFIVDNFHKIHEIEKMIKNKEGYSFNGFEEMPLTEDNFIDIYMKRGGYEKAEFSQHPPKPIIMGPHNELSKKLYDKAASIWVKTYPENIEMIESYYIEKIKSELPRFIDTGNPQKDNLNYTNAKDKWIKDNPEKYDRLNRYRENSN